MCGNTAIPLNPVKFDFDISCVEDQRVEQQAGLGWLGVGLRLIVIVPHFYRAYLVYYCLEAREEGREMRKLPMTTLAA